jgi:N12 class adenine-specific DNA methylase
MPQIKGEQRGALVNFLAARGIEHANDTVPARSLKPTQAEYSRTKVDKFKETGAIGERSVLVSSDGHVLDGHHQWLGMAELGQDIPVIRLGAPIVQLLDAVNEFPSVRRGEGGITVRDQAVSDFKAALADLAQIATRNTRAAMIPEETPKLMETLVRLFDAAIKIVGTDMKAALRYVKEQLRKDPENKKLVNFIKESTYQKAALQAIESQGQADPFAGEAPTVAMIGGRAYDAKRDNFKPAAVKDFMDPGVLSRADGYVDKYFKNRPPVNLSQEDRARAEALLGPLMEKAAADKVAYDQKIIDIAARAGAMGQMLAPIKGISRAAEKLVLEEQFNVDGMKDTLRSTIVVESYGKAQAVLDEIEREFKLLRAPKNRTNSVTIKSRGVDVVADDPDRTGGYTDILVNVVMPSGLIAEIQINVPELLAAKEGQGHKLYEAAREAPKESPLGVEILAAMREFYDAAFAAAAARAASSKPAGSGENVMPPRGAPARPAAMPGRGSSEAPSSDSLNQPSPGISTNQSPPKVGTNSQPAGNLFGSLIDSPTTDSVAQKPANGYSAAKDKGESDVNGTDGRGGDQGKGAGTAQATGGKGRTARVRPGPVGPDLFGDGGPDAGATPAGTVGQAGPDGVRSQDADGGGAEPGDRNGASAPVPAGRDIPAKSGRNYEFGPDDLTYAGSWQVKAAANVDAVELVKRLEAEGRQATREEQAVLAKFIGWGSSEIANTIFGNKLDKVLSSKADYDAAIAAMDKLKRDWLNKGGQYRGSYADDGYYQAAKVLRAAGKISEYQFPDRISRAELESVKPSPADLRWVDLRDRLKAALTPEEWAEASRSTQYAHYTSKAVVKAMWGAMERMGFKGGAILEPGAGIGVFPGLMPSSMAFNSAYTGIEFDGITGAILKQLFPDERILVESFVDSKLPKNFYDVAAGNPPFSQTKILGDPEYAKQSLALHDYFFAKTIDRVKPGGLVMFVTSRFTMDKLNDKARQYLADRADLVGAIRLPQTAFKQNAGTDVVTDVLFLRKKVPGEKFDQGQAWGKSVPMTINGRTFPVNEYFHAHPEMVLGTHSDEGSMQNSPEPQYTVKPLAGDIEEQFSKATGNLPADIYKAELGSAAQAAKVREIDFNPNAKKEGNYYVTPAGVLMVREGGVGVRVEGMPAKDMEIVKDIVPLRDALKQAHYDQLNDGPWEQSLAALQAAYAKFTKKNGPINQFTTRMVKTKTVDEETGETYADEEARRTFTLLKKIEDDPDWTLLAALENVNDDTGAITPSAFLSERVLGKPTEASVSTPTDALLTVLNDVGTVDIPAIAHRINMSPADTIEALGTSIYQDPSDGWLTADEYLSGNVKRKLKEAREAARADARYERNVTALEAVQPAPLEPSKINAAIGMNWIPGKVYSDFLQQTAGVRARIEWNARAKAWIVEELGGGSTTGATDDWGTTRRNATQLMEAALTGREIRIETRDPQTKKATFDAGATELANQKLDALREEFQKWLWKDQGRTTELVQLYNDKFNTTVPRSFDGRHLTLPGTSKRWSVFDHVKRGAWRIIQSGNTYLAHAVGSGKTFQMVISAMEQKRLGLIQKPMVVVPNHMLQQFAREWQDLYPAARLMVADENNFHTDNRRRFVSRVALSDLDGVIITQSAFKLLDLDPEFKQKIINQQLEYMRAAYDEAGGNSKNLTLVEDGKNAKGEMTYKLDGGSKDRDPKIKQIERQIERMEQKLMAATSSVGKDTNARFDELGVDFLYVDEAHNYRKLDFTTNRQVKGISPGGSDMALDLFMKSRFIEEKRPGRSIVMASGTPVTNTIAELFTVQKFMDYQALEEKGIEDFDSWAAMFGREVTALESNAAGKYEPVTRFAKFANVPELTQMFREFADVLNSDHLAALLGDKRPKVEGGSRKIVTTPETAQYMEFREELEQRVRISKEWKPSKDEPNNPDPIIKIIGDGRLAAIDMRFMRPGLPSDPESKLNRLIDDVIRVAKETADLEYNDKAGKPEPNKGAAMMVFSDLGFGAGVAASRGFNARAWFEKRLRDAGVPMNQVAFMSDYKKSADKLKLFKDVNAGRVRILVGSSKNMGTGVNAQQRLKALFHLDSPWYPADLEQREGRIVRQGNKNPKVQIYAYAAKGSYDETMWGMLARKQYFIDQALSGDENLREIEDLDSQSQYALVAAMVAKDPRVLQLAGMRADIAKMMRLYEGHEQQRAKFRNDYWNAQATVKWAQGKMAEAERAAGKVIDLSGDKFTARVGGKDFTVRTEWAQALIDRYKDLAGHAEMQEQTVGSISGYNVVFAGAKVGQEYSARIYLDTPEAVGLVYDADTNLVGMTMRATNALAALAGYPAKLRERIQEARAVMDAVQSRLETPFPMAGMLADKVREADALEAAIASPTAPEEEMSFEDALAGAALGGIPPMVLSRGTGGGMDVNVLQAIAQRIKSTMPNMPTVRVLRSPADAPKALREYIERQGAWNDVDGAMHKGELYLFASGLPDAMRAEHVLAEHEAAHFGLRAILGSSLNGAMQLIYNNNASVRQAAKAMQARGKLTNAQATEEVLVDIPTAQLARLTGWRKLVSKIRDGLAARGYEAMAAKLSAWLDGSMTEQQRADLFAADLVRAARGYVAGKVGGRYKVGSTGTRLSGTLADDFVKQEKWLTAEAQARGYKDIDELAEKDYPLFEKLAKLWRERNPADMLLSRGKPIPTATPEFRRWFGSSKVVDADGKPLLVYHGTPIKGGLTEFSTQNGAIYFTNKRAIAEDYTSQRGVWRSAKTGDVMEVYLSLQNPLIVDALGKRNDNIPVPWQEWKPKVFGAKSADAMNMEKISEYAKANGHDGVIVRNVVDTADTQDKRKSDVFIAFRSEQIKSAIGNRGTFDPADPDIRMSRGAGQVGTPAFRAWFQGSKMVNPDGSPMVVYHGTNKDIASFKTGRGAIWFAESPSLANMFVAGGRRNMGAKPKKGSAVYPVYLRLTNPLDLGATSPGDRLSIADVLKMAGLPHGQAALEAIAKRSLDSGQTFVSPSMGDPVEYLARDYARNGYASNTLDHGALREVLQEAGFDGLTMTEDGSRTFAVFDPSQVKSAVGNTGAFDQADTDIRMSRAPAPATTPTAAQRADTIIQTSAATAKPIDNLVRGLTRITGIERMTGAVYNRAAYLLDRYTPEQIKAGMVSDYGVPESVIDQRAMMQGRQRVQLRQAGNLLDKLATLTREESRVAYEWMNETDPKTIYRMMQNLPDESVKVLLEVQQMIDKLSKEAVRMGQLSPEAYEANKFAYLRRSYAKYTLDQTAVEKAGRARAISILGDQYRGRGLTEAASMKQIQNAAPEWWKRKMVDGKADVALKGEKFIRMERRAPNGAKTIPLAGMTGKADGKLLEVQYHPVGAPLPARYADWNPAGTFQVRDVKGDKVVLWRDFTKDERERMGEIDEARFAIAKTLQGMIHDVEVGRYLEWLAHTQAKKEGETIPGQVVEASEAYGHVFKPGEWVKVPDSKIAGTTVLKYGKLAGRYLPGPVWNDLRQVVNGQFRPFGETYGKLLSMWKTSKTALSPAVHMNNVMSSLVMADWHDVTAGHTAKALRILLAARGSDAKGGLGRVGNVAAGVLGAKDREAAVEIKNRYLDSGGDIGSWATNEISQEQISPLLEQLERELASTNGGSAQAQVGIMAALQHAIMLRFPSAWDAAKNSKPGQVVAGEGKALIDMYQAEDDVFRLAAWLKAKEEGRTDMEAGKIARRSFLDYHINAPWVQALRNSVLPFVSFTYRAVPMMLETAGKKPHKLMKLMLLAGAVNALGVMIGGGGDDDERKLLPEEKAGRIWGLVPKLIRMPWNDANSSPVYLDIRRFIPVGDVVDLGAGHSAVPLLPAMQPGGPLVIFGEIIANRSMFTGKPINLETDTGMQATGKVVDHLWKAFAPNILGLPGTYATTGVGDAIKGKTDAFGREQSVAQAVASSFGVKLGSYPADVLRRNERAKAAAQVMEIDRNISALKRQLQTRRISNEDFQEQVRAENDKKRKVMQDLQEKVSP